MHIIEPLFQKHRDRTTLGLLIILALSLMIIPPRAKISIGRAGVNGIFLPINHLAQFVEDFRSAKSENEQLRRIVASLLLERERLDQFRLERERLRRLAEFKEEQFLELVPCEVIGRNLDRYQTVLVIDKGANDSLKVRMPVFSYEGYVGRLIEVFENSAWVQLICSRNNPVSCIDKRSRIVGILEWAHQTTFELKNVGVVEEVAVGDTLITSGYGGVVPKGFPVAVITEVTPAIDGLSYKIEAESHITFHALEEVFVAINEISWDKAIFYSGEDSLQIYGKPLDRWRKNR
jgi:rod shape-determining protein MreC